MDNHRSSHPLEKEQTHTPKFVESKLKYGIIEKLEIKVPFIQRLLEEGVVLAGGAVMWAILDLPDNCLKDIDLFVLNGNQFKLERLAELVDDQLPGRERYYSVLHNSVLTIHIEGLPAIQFVLSRHNNAENEIGSFDLDPIQVAIYQKNNEHYLLATEWALQSHINKEIRYILNESYNSMHLESRLYKLQWKGFKLPVGYTRLEQLKVRLWDVEKKKQKEDNIHVTVSKIRQPEESYDSGSRTFCTWDDHRAGIKSKGQLRDKLKEAIREINVPLSKANYDFPEVKWDNNQPQFQFIYLPDINKADNELDNIIIELRNRNDKEKMECYNLIRQGKYMQAINQAFSEAGKKLHINNPLSVFCLAEENRIMLEKVVAAKGVTRDIAMMTLERVLGEVGRGKCH